MATPLRISLVTLGVVAAGASVAAGVYFSRPLECPEGSVPITDADPAACMVLDFKPGEPVATVTPTRG